MDNISTLNLIAEEINQSKSSTSLTPQSGASSSSTSSSLTSHPSITTYPCMHHTLGQPGTWNPCCNCFFSALPDTLISNEIFTYLNLSEKLHLASTSSRFNYIIENTPKLWKEIKVLYTPSSGIGLQRLLQRKGENIQSLILRNGK